MYTVRSVTRLGNGAVGRQAHPESNLVTNLLMGPTSDRELEGP